MEYVIAGLIVGAFIGGVIFFIKKENKKLEEMMSNLSNEQKNKLALTDIKFVEGKNDEWIQEGMIAEMRDKGNKFAIKVLWHNKVIQNAAYDQCIFFFINLLISNICCNFAPAFAKLIRVMAS